jgi:hypothetical protein
MHNKGWSMLLVLLMAISGISLTSGVVSAHSPNFPGDNTSLSKALTIDQPSKSWAVYQHLEESTVQYYKMDFKAGDRVYLNAIIPTDEKGTGFLPQMALVGPFTQHNGSLPASVEVPVGYGWITVVSALPSGPTYEAFSPSAFYNLAVFDEVAPTNGTYYVAVFQTEGTAPIHGNYALAIGYIESFTVTEMILIPSSLINVYQWEGQGMIQILAPTVITSIVGLAALFYLRKETLVRMGPAHITAMVSGLLFLGTGTSTAVQMFLVIDQTGFVSEALLTSIFILAPLLIGWFFIRSALKARTPLSRIRRMEMLLIAVVGLFTWGGLLIGPVLGMISSVLPSRKLRMSELDQRKE